MPNVAFAFASGVAKAAGASIAETGEVIAGGQVIFRISPPVEGKISDKDYFDLIDFMRAFYKDEAGLVFRLAETIVADDIGTLGLAMKTAPTLRDSLVRLTRYFQIVTDTAVYRLDETISPVHLYLLAQTQPRPALHFRDEGALAAIAQNLKAIVGPDLAFEHVSFAHPCRDDPARYRAFFGCDVRFDAPHNAIAMQKGMLRLPNRLGDRAVSEFLTDHLEQEMAVQHGTSPLKTQLLKYLAPQLSSGVPSAADVASAVGLSERTLYRRLADEGLTFRELLQDVQTSMARELLEDPDIPIAEIAFRTGFAEQSTFSRAFKRRVGEAPAKYRQAASGG